MSSGRRITLGNIIRNALPLGTRRQRIDMTPGQMDTVVKYQLGLPTPLYLEEHSLIWAGIVQKERQAAATHKLLVKHGYVLAHQPAGADDSTPMPLTVNTRGIDRNFPRQFPDLSPLAHRKLVCLLFFWEEEVNRWRLLSQEEEIVRQALAQATGHAVQDLSIALEAVTLKKKLLPSQRAEGATTVIPPMQEALPTYSEAS